MSLDSNAIILAIEAAVAGGSIAITRGTERITGWAGPADVSRAEDLLFNVDILLRQSGIDKKDLSLIAVSAGPGSFTGIRIGLATGLGLKAGLGIPMATCSALEAMAAASGIEGMFTVAVPAGRNAVCMQRFNGPTPASEPETIRATDVAAIEGKLLVHERLVEIAGGDVVDLGGDLAYAIAQFCFENPDSATPPMFISKSF